MKTFFLIIAFLILMVAPLAAEEGRDLSYLREGNAYLEAQEYQKAVQAFREAARLNPDNADAQNGLGISYFKMGYSEAATNVEVVENAVTAFKEVLRLAPRSAETRYQLGVAYLVLYDKESALKEYEALKDLDAGLAEQLKFRIDKYKKPKSFGKVVTRVGGENEPTTRVTMVGNQVLVPVTLTHDGTTVQTTLVLDTGASSTLITSEVANRLNLKFREGGRAKFQVADGRVVQAWHTKVDQIRVGSKSQDGLDIVIVESGANFPFEGLLGMDFLRHFKHSVDFNNQVINWQ